MCRVEGTEAIPQKEFQWFDWSSRNASALEVILGGIVGILRIPEEGINLAAKQSSSESTGS